MKRNDDDDDDYLAIYFHGHNFCSWEYVNTSQLNLNYQLPI